MNIGDRTPEENRRDIPELMTIDDVARLLGVARATVYRKIRSWKLIDPKLVVEQPELSYRGTTRVKSGRIQIRRDPLLLLIGSDTRGEVNEEIWRASRSIDVIRIEQKRMIQRVQALESAVLEIRAKGK